MAPNKEKSYIKNCIASIQVTECLNGLAPPYLQELFSYTSHGIDIRLNIPSTHTKYGSCAFNVIGPRIFNSLPRTTKDIAEISTFKKHLKTYLLTKCDYELDFNPRSSFKLLH